MNATMSRYIIGRMLAVEAAFLLVPAFTALVYGEQTGIAYCITAVISLVGSLLLSKKKPKATKFYAREGFVTVALCWIVLAAVGALPFFIGGEIPFYVDALFESISGFTTTGATILADVEALSHASLLWRSLMHWIGGMGILVFMLAILPLAGGNNIHLLRAESPGPSVSKLAPHMKDSASLLYFIYFGITLLEVVFLLFGKMSLFDAVNTALSTTGTGGFGMWNNSIAHYDSMYLQAVISIFMILSGVNFGIYFLILTRKFKSAFKNEELRLYLGVIFASAVLITINISRMFDGNLFESFHHALFSVASIITTTGFATVDFDLWPAFSKAILVVLMFIGACAGSTGGGIKCSRMLLMLKSVKKELQFLLHPRLVRANQMDGRTVPHEVLRSTNVFFIVYVLLVAFSVLLLSLTSDKLLTNFTAVVSAISNIGPGLEGVGPSCNYGFFTPLSKIVLMFDMLAGRLEIFPILLLLSPSTWSKNK